MMIQNIFLGTLCLLGMLQMGYAQQKPLNRHSKKQLIAMLEAQQAKNDSLQMQLSKEQEARAKERAASKNEYKVLHHRLEQLEQEHLALSEKYEQLNVQYLGLCKAPPKEVEVLDLYSFGYQPLQYSESSYQKQLKIARDAVVEFRMNNAQDLVRLLQSHKVDDEVKKLLFQSFKKAYQGYFNDLTQAQLTYYNPKIEEILRRGIRQKTYKEINLIEKENRWIQMLENY